MGYTRYPRSLYRFNKTSPPCFLFVTCLQRSPFGSLLVPKTLQANSSLVGKVYSITFKDFILAFGYHLNLLNKPELKVNIEDSLPSTACIRYRLLDHLWPRFRTYVRPCGKHKNVN